MLALIFSAPASSSPLSWQRQHLVKARHAALACQESRYVHRSPTDHAEHSRSVAYLNATRLHWKARHANCERRLAADRVRWRRDPVAHAKQIARYLLDRRGWSDQYACLDALIMSESKWHVTADNPHSDAYGIPQALPGSKMGPGWRTDPEVQLRWLLYSYIGPGHKYHDPCSAWSYRRSAGSY